MKRLKKLTREPGVFFRDYFNKKYPVRNIEQRINEIEEPAIIANSLHLAAVESAIHLSPFKIDVVFTWVDNSDTQWQQRHQQYCHAASPNNLYSNDETRFANHNELYYSLHSVRSFLPWVNHIYIITDSQTPKWFKSAEYPNVSIIDHSEIIDKQYLPTFNSHVIEAHLHNIPNLSEHFIYFNDDVFVARPLHREHFFHANGIASLFIADKSLQKMATKGTITPTLSASQNCIRLLNQRYDCNLDHPLVHTYVPLRKSGFQTAWQYYREEIKAFLPNKFRTNQDLNLATFLVPWLMYLDGKSIPNNDICYYFNIRSNKAPTQYLKLLQKNEDNQQPHSFCANDFHSEQQLYDYHAKLIAMLKDYFKI
uniref:Capsular polysaccharide phosphotransferase LcbA n=2 Tax=Neisseria meningitidis TaxID=487 RepID=LCBA_NEIME|nr:RecName: Full=Capsular polysaccharide phosphotransferase LcbA; AltName: Full=Stealth protein LcbA [Neisseria meningitidis]AAF21950.1 LcbA [Neisseria meningitidis]AEQ62071.1 LcbA [Neisseria meningitidis]CCP19790.1 capsule phosphotransferase [Neisseria meningitidis]